MAGLGLILPLLLACARAPEPADEAPAGAAKEQARKVEPPRKVEQAAVDRRKVVEARSTQADLLEALGYVDGQVAARPEERGVLRHDPARSQPGLSLVYSRTQEQAQLVELDGSVVHTWAVDTPGYWQHVELDPVTGGVIVLVKDQELWSLDRDGGVRWRREGRYHHDLAVDDQGNLYVLARRARRIPELHPELELLDDVVQVLSPTGEQLAEWSVIEALRASPYAFLLPDTWNVKARPGSTTDLDPLHTNHISVMDGSLAHLSPLFAQGNVLLSLRNAHAVLILDGDSHEVLWIWGPGHVTFQHHPTVLDNGHVLLFDNGTKRSRVVQVDPAKNRVVWSYGGPPDFYSETRGSAQRLQNGNTLITVSDTGMAIEVTPQGEVVWEYANPEVAPDGVRGALWRVTRYPPGSVPFLGR